MARPRREGRREGLLRRVRRQRLRYITVLPSLVTIVNGLCGFGAIVLASKGPGARMGGLSVMAVAGYLVLLAMIADVLDGRLARMSKSTSSFGGQLDSLCDVVSFGVAPAFLMVKILEQKVGAFTEFHPAVANLISRFVWLAAAAYISCAAIRLARFNVENEEDESAHMSFMGLPTPAAAGAVVSLVIFHQEALPELSSEKTWLYSIFDHTVLYVLPFIALGLAALMVSRIRYPHVINQYLKGKKPFAYLIRVLLFIGLILWSRQAAFVVIFCGFALGGVVRWFYHRVADAGAERAVVRTAAEAEVVAVDVAHDS